MFSTRFICRSWAAAVAAATLACRDAAIPTAPTDAAPLTGIASLSEGRGAFQRYVALGTSLSMGVASDGTTAESQYQSWPAQLARMAQREITQPYIGGTGCRSPLQAPLASGVRISGEPAATSPASLSCAELAEGPVTLVQNLAINGALVRDALFTTPENITDAGNAKVYTRVLLPGHTQISSLEEQNPKFVSIEFGANELLQVQSGVAIEGATMFPYAAWAPLFTQLTNRVAAATKYGLIVGLIHEVANLPGQRRGRELYADRARFAAAFNVAIAEDCNGSENLVWILGRVPRAVATGIAMAKAGAGPYTFSCADGGMGVQDGILTPAEAAVVNAQATRMNDYMKAEAERVGFAFFELDALFRPEFKPAFNVVNVMTSAQPFGPYSSLDGTHPSALGQRVVAEAAAKAVDERYGFGMSGPLIALR